MSAAPRPGWYPDPAGTPDLYRWWDGGDWTEAISESPRAPSPRTQHPADPADDLRPRRPSRFRAVVALVVCLALFLSATVGLGLAIWQDPPTAKRSLGARAGAAVSPGLLADRGAAVGRLDQRTRQATVGAGSMTLPDLPYQPAAEPLQVPGLLEVSFSASAPVHEGYDGHRSWSAAVLLGRLAGTGDEAQLEDHAVAAVRKLSTTFFRSAPTRLAEVSVAEHSVDGNSGVRVTAEVHYDIEGLPSRYDRVTAVVVGLDDGSMLVAVSAVPDDAGAQLGAQAAESLETLAIS